MFCDPKDVALNGVFDATKNLGPADLVNINGMSLYPKSMHPGSIVLNNPIQHPTLGLMLLSPIATE